MIFSRGTERVMKWCSLILVAFIVAFGPITGVVAAGLIYGNSSIPAWKASLDEMFAHCTSDALASLQIFFMQSPLNRSTAFSLKQSNLLYFILCRRI